ncbi:MAG: hypothetical protein KatS3mg113_0349 [Planctomycetaceae bacterium]|nr:MAG: hypothetical protein KatS3mg113_0349 [Planctomycetaceae bacterium]
MPVSPQGAQVPIFAVHPRLMYWNLAVEELCVRPNVLATAGWLLQGEHVGEEWLADWQALWSEALVLPPAVKNWIERHALQLSLTMVIHQVLSLSVCQRSWWGREAQRRHDNYPLWLGRLLGVIQYWTWCRNRMHARRQRGRSCAAILYRLTHDGPMPRWWEQTVEGLFVLGAEHGMSPATSTVVAVAQRGGSWEQALMSAWQVLDAPGATPHQAARCWTLLQSLKTTKTTRQLTNWLHRLEARRGELPGFQHPAYRLGDPRAEVVEGWCRNLAPRVGEQSLEELAHEVEQIVWDRLHRLPALAWPLGRLLHYLGFIPDYYVPLAALSRLAGWFAHYEQSYIAQGVAPLRSSTVQTFPSNA